MTAAVALALFFWMLGCAGIAGPLVYCAASLFLGRPRPFPWAWFVAGAVLAASSLTYISTCLPEAP
jgi:hypothetical protein